MKRSFGSLPPAAVAILVLASLPWPPCRSRRWRRRWWRRWRRWWRRRPRVGRRRRWRRWRRAHAGGGGGGGARQNAQVNNSKADARTNNVRSTSVNNVNNVNVERNVNVNAATTIAATTAGTTTITRSPPRRRWGDGCRDLGDHRLDGAHRPAGLRAGELRRHGLPAMRRHLVCRRGRSSSWSIRRIDSRIASAECIRQSERQGQDRNCISSR